jgi:hypothetical protein
MNIKRFYPLLFSFILLVINALPASAHVTHGHAPFGLSNKWIVLISFILTFIGLLGTWFIARQRLWLSQYTIIGLTLLTAFIHLFLGVHDLLLFLNGLGYLALLVALYAPQPDLLVKFRQPVYWALMGYTLLTILLYFVAHPWGLEGGSLDKLGLGTKVIELLLVGLTFVELMLAGRPFLSQRWFAFQLNRGS